MTYTKLWHVTGTGRDTRLQRCVRGVRLACTRDGAVFTLHSKGDDRDFDCDSVRRGDST